MSQTNFEIARKMMVDCQIRPSKVTNENVLDAFLTVPREAFVGKSQRAIAYVDEDLPLPGGRNLMEPMILARLVQALEVRPGDSVLVVGAATGYGSAIMARLSGSVIAVEARTNLVEKAQETLRTALAMGADRAILVVAAEDVHQDIEPLAVAKILKAIVEEEQPGLVLCGKQAIDNDMNATGQMLAALLGWSQATFASELSVEGDAAVVTREVDGGLQTIKVTMPAIVTVDLRLNEPRYASLPNIMKARKKPLDQKTAADLGVDVAPRLSIVNTGEPEARSAGIKVGSVDELVEKLKEAGAV